MNIGSHRAGSAATWIVLCFCAGAAGCGGERSDRLAQASPTVPGVKAAPRADCGPGSRPETGVQGRVSRAEHDSGRADQGYTCNTELVGSYTIPNVNGTVGGFKVERYVDRAGRECAYYDTNLVAPLGVFDNQEVGVNVIDMSNPTKPTLMERLLTPAMATPHESLVVSSARGLLVAAAGNPAVYPGWVDVYDIAEDCRHPVLKSSLPLAPLGHESGIAPDGRTFYVASPVTPTITAIDLSDPANPVPLANLPYYSHGLSISEDGNRAYVAGIGLSGAVLAYADVGAVPDPALDRALVILDVSEIQARKPNPQVRELARLAWRPMSIPQNAIPITIKGHPYVVEVDEFEREGEVGAARIIDIGDETRPKVISDLRLEVHQPEHYTAAAGDPGYDFSGGSYAAHYCNVPTRRDPPIVACAMILSGLRVFDIRDPHNPREVAYFNAPVNPKLAPAPTEASNYALASPAFAPARKEIWYTDGYSGFYAVRVTNGAWPD